MAILVEFCLSGDARLAAGTMSSGALMSGVFALLLDVGALREGALAERPAVLNEGDLKVVRAALTVVSAAVN